VTPKCEECRWYSVNSLKARVCSSPARDLTFPDYERSKYGPCGPAGKLFQRRSHEAQIGGEAMKRWLWMRKVFGYIFCGLAAVGVLTTIFAIWLDDMIGNGDGEGWE